MADDSAGRIVAAMRAWIATAPPGAQLPSNRALMVEHGASPVTVQKAVRQLSALGLVESRPGVGTFVRTVRQNRPADLSWQTAALGAPRARLSGLSSTQRASVPDAIALHSGYPGKDLLPERLVRAALARVARAEAALMRSPAAGLPELQAWFASQVADAAPVGVSPPSARDVLILAGSQSGLSSLFRALVGPGQPLLIESPTYWGAILAAEQAGVTLVPVPTGAHGPDPDDVDRAFAATGARAFYAQPTFANPTGTQWSADTGAAVLDIVRARGAFLIEDDWAHDLAIDADPQPLVGHDDDGHVIYLRSLTKSVSPALPWPQSSPAARRASASSPTARPRPCTSAVSCRQRRSTSSPNPAGRCTCGACASSSGSAETCSSTASGRTRRRCTSSTSPSAG